MTLLPPDKQKDSMVEEDQLSPKTPPDQTPKNVPGPGSRTLSRENYCLSKTLDAFEVIPENPMLFFDAHEASILIDCPGIVDYLPSSTFSKCLLIYDGDNRRFDMLLSQYVNSGRTNYSLAGEWKYFVKTHRLKAGDEVTFYKISDKSVSDEDYYVIKYFRKPADVLGYRQKPKPSGAGQRDLKGNKKTDQLKVDRAPLKIRLKLPFKRKTSEVEDDQDRRNVQGPGSRILPPEAYCLSKILTSSEVVRVNPKLYLDAYEASVLTNCPEIVNYRPGTCAKFLPVFDADNSQYTMFLSHHISEGRIGYSLAAGWNKFVRTHDLKAGDKITFYRVLDRSVSNEYYYVIRHFRGPVEPQGDDGPGGMDDEWEW